MAYAPRQESPYVTPEERDQLELEHDVKYEWYNGEIFAMAGASFAHNRLAGNAYASLHSQLRGQPCEPLGSDQRVSISVQNANVYPDITVVCEPHEWDETHRHSLLNPRAVIEVLSPSTEKRDRNAKFTLYQSLASLKHYILIASTHQCIEHYERDGDSARWIYTVARQDDECIEISDINCRLCVRDVYERLDLPPLSLMQRDDEEKD